MVEVEVVADESGDDNDSEKERTQMLTQGRVTNYDDWLEKNT